MKIRQKVECWCVMEIVIRVSHPLSLSDCFSNTMCRTQSAVILTEPIINVPYRRSPIPHGEVVQISC